MEVKTQKQFTFKQVFSLTDGRVSSELVNFHTIDYLRSKGYALPYMGKSAEYYRDKGYLKPVNEKQ